MWTILKNSSAKRFSGRFALSNGAGVLGDLELNGDRTELRLRSDNPFHITQAQNDCLAGSLDICAQVSLFDCVILQHGSTSWKDEQYTSATIYPHYALFGAERIRPDQTIVSGVSFVIDDAHIVFHDGRAFGCVFGANDVISKMIADRENLEVGRQAWVTYYTGKPEIVCAATCFGDLTIRHNPSGNFGDATGVRIDNAISVNVDFASPTTFAEATARVISLLRYLDLVAGRPQNVTEMSIILTKEIDGNPVELDVYWCTSPRRKATYERRKPISATVLVSPIRNAAAYGSILARWLEANNTRLAARQRFSESFGQQHFFTIDRLVGAANMFDLLPEDALPAALPLSPALEAAKKQAYALFVELPRSIERESMLNAIGRIGKNSLRQKIRYRAKAVIECLGPRFLDLTLVTDQAVICRNHYVHGERQSTRYAKKLDRAFLTETLEFVFATSDLIDAGWDMKGWMQSHPGFWHPFADYIRDYERNLETLQKLLEQHKALGA